MMEIQTHLSIDPALCGKVVHLEDGYAKVLLHTTQQMSADTMGLVHGGFIFGMADYAAMVAVNDPYVVLGAAQTRFIAPVRVGDAVSCEARVSEGKGKKVRVLVRAFVADRLVFEGDFTAFILKEHVLRG